MQKGTPAHQSTPHPPATGFVPMVIPAGKQGTCELSTKNQHKCNGKNGGRPCLHDSPTAHHIFFVPQACLSPWPTDGMEGAVDSTDYTLLSMMVDPEAMQRCGFSDMDKIVNSVSIQTAW